MKQSNEQKPEGSQPDYVRDLQASYGPPSSEGFGSAVFFETDVASDDLEDAAKKTYEQFVGDLWARWGEEAWMGPWQEAYARQRGVKPDVVKELRGIEDFNTKMQVEMILDNIDNAEKAREALATAYDAPEVTDLRAYNIGDGSAMSGLLLAGRRENGETTFLVFLYD